MKRKINKKLLSGMILPLIVAVVLVSAFILVSYGSVEQNIEVKTPIEISSDTLDITAWLGQETIIRGELITIENVAPFDVEVEVNNDAEEGIDVTYIGELELTKKTVDFESDVWDILGDKVQIEYTAIGEEFNAEVTAGEISGYVLVYYVDNDDRFANPGEVILVEDVSENLPGTSDANANLNDYSVEYPTTPFGAKIWYVPSDAIPSGVIDWTRASEFYFESKLIQYNSDGILTIYEGETLELIPVYTIVASTIGTNTVTTTVNNVE